MPAPPATVDVHTHFFPAGLPDLARDGGDARWPSLHVDDRGRGRIMQGSTVFRPVAPTCFDPHARLAAMDAASIDVHVLSPVPITLTTWAAPLDAARFARAQNEALADAAATAPDRYRWFGSVPLQDAALAIEELERIRSLGGSGVEIGTEVCGRELDDASLRPFFAAAAELGVPVFVHPTDGRNAIRRGGQPFEFGLGMLTDTAMAAAALVFGGVLDELPSLRICLAHGCGTFAWAYPRLARGTTLGGPTDVPFDSRRLDDLVRLLWVDSLVFDPLHIPLLLERFGDDHVVLGSDFPFYPAAWGGACEVLDDACSQGLCTPAQVAGARADNGLRFLSQGA